MILHSTTMTNPYPTRHQLTCLFFKRRMSYLSVDVLPLTHATVQMLSTVVQSHFTKMSNGTTTHDEQRSHGSMRPHFMILTAHLPVKDPASSSCPNQMLSTLACARKTRLVSMTWTVKRHTQHKF